MANRNKNIFAYLDSDDEDVPKVSKKAEAPPAAPVALNKPAAGNKKTQKKPVVEGEKKTEKKERAPRDGEARAPRGGRGAGRGGRGGRREFERRSGTGRGKETSKQGGGARNWGNDNDKSELVAEAAVQEGKVEGEDEVAEEAPVEEEEEEVQLTLDEYLAKKKESRSGELFAEVEVRQVADEFTNAVQITKEGKTPDFIEAQYEKVFSKKTSGRKKQLITDLGFQAPAPERRFRDNEDSRGGRGGRGGARGGRGARGGARGGRTGAAPNVADLKAFPSL
ncbi:hypothetical protein Poli38472_000627 [Pythium oligandrum]|uniref:Hyaluronan/mRNA-binding protein domain-containing protein n=1 Tax=Pythium oligandrum TaxID=41045 RepID=A0A8K1FEI5_PYTOL|nr:hypothetical protein Poli38472_000627 [Pythium oligandrum]|eukprot:TMW60585.1 hypothetical protein Poli38472_000627 [Pythium oligandrum]